MAAKYLKEIQDICKQAGKEEPALCVKMVGYAAHMRLGSKKWMSSVQPTSSKAIVDVAKQAISDLQPALASVQEKKHDASNVMMNSV